MATLNTESAGDVCALILPQCLIASTLTTIQNIMDDLIARTRTHSDALACTHARTRTHHAQGDWEQDVIQDADVEVRCSDINHVCGILGESIRFQVCVKAWPVATPRIHFGFSLLEDTDGGHRPPLKWGRRKYCHQGSLSSR